MPRPRVQAAGGFASVAYALRKAREAGGVLRFYRRMRQRSACKACALGMGGQGGGMVDESGHFPEVCKKSLQAQSGDMSGVFTEEDAARHPIAQLESFTSAQLERLGRIAFPLVARGGDTHYRRVSWGEALDTATQGMREAEPGGTFFYASGRSSNEAAFLMQVVARAWGTANINNCSCYCHNASGAALSRVYGSGTASVVLDDLARADFALIAGANPASNHPRLITQLVRMRRRGGRVAIVNPLRELGLVRFRVPSDARSMLLGSTVSDIYLQPHIGSDLALFQALLKGVIESGGVDASFIRDHTSGWDAVRDAAEGCDWDELVGACGVPRDQIDEAVRMLLRARRGVFCWAMGLTHHAHGVDTILALSNLALALGWLGRPGCGLLPLRGHSNVQGVGSVGVTPALKSAFAERMEALYGVPASLSNNSAGGWDTYASMRAAEEGTARAAFLLGGNLYGSNPDLRWASRALRTLPLTVFVSTKWNTGHVHGRGRTSIILPALARDEEPQSTTQESMFNYVRLSNAGTPSVSGQIRSEVDIIASIAERLLPAGRFDWANMRSHRHLREGIASIVPGYGSIARVEEPGGEFQIEGRTFHAPPFGTPDGRARFHDVRLPGRSAGEETFRLMTLRSEGQFNTVVYEEEDLYRGNRRRDVVMMAPDDAHRLGLEDGDGVRVVTEAGEMAVVVSLVDIRPGNLAMYYPEANILVPRRVDPASGTPAFKSVTASIVPRTRSAGA